MLEHLESVAQAIAFYRPHIDALGLDPVTVARSALEYLYREDESRDKRKPRGRGRRCKRGWISADKKCRDTPPGGGKGRSFSPPLRTDRLAERRSRIVAAAGEKLVRKAEKAVQAALESVDIYIQMKEGPMRAVMGGDRYRNMFEVPAQYPDWDLSLATRRSAEKLLFGTPIRAGARQRPVYGFPASSKKFSEAPYMIPPEYTFGKFSIRLKPEVRSRATFTLADSMTAPEKQWGKEVSFQPSSLNNINIASVVSLKDDTDEKIRERVARFASVKNSNDLFRVGQEDYGIKNYMENEAHPTFFRGGGVYANLGLPTVHRSHKQAQLLGKRPDFLLGRFS